MTPAANTERYKHPRFPGEISSHGVWLYYRFSLSYRDVQEFLCECSIDVTSSHPPMVSPGRAGLCQSAASPPTPPRGYMASRRGVVDSERQAPVPISSRATPPSARGCRTSSSGRAATCTTGVSTRIGQRAQESVAGRGCSPQAMPSAFCLRLDPWPNTVDPGGICGRHEHTVKRGGIDARVGPR